MTFISGPDHEEEKKFRLVSFDPEVHHAADRIGVALAHGTFSEALAALESIRSALGQGESQDNWLEDA